MVLSSVYGQNSEELSAMEKIASQIRCEVTLSGNGISLSIDYEGGDSGDYLDIIQHGMPAPLTGGQGGIVTNPDGSTRQSNVPEELWGNPIDEYAKAGTDVQGEIEQMLNTLFSEEVRSIASSSSAEIAAIAKKQILNTMATF